MELKFYLIFSLIKIGRNYLKKVIIDAPISARVLEPHFYKFDNALFFEKKTKADTESLIKSTYNE